MTPPHTKSRFHFHSDTKKQIFVCKKIIIYILHFITGMGSTTSYNINCKGKKQQKTHVWCIRCQHRASRRVQESSSSASRIKSRESEKKNIQKQKQYFPRKNSSVWSKESWNKSLRKGHVVEIAIVEGDLYWIERGGSLMECLLAESHN